MIYFLTPLYAAGAITEAEIDKLEAQLIRKQLGLEGDVKNENIMLMMNFYSRTTASIISENGTVLRSKVNSNHRAKPKKHFIEKQPLTEQERTTSTAQNNLQS